MRDEVLRIGGILRPEPERERQLSRVADDLGEEEFAEWMLEYEAGQWVLACVEMFADIGSEDGVARFCDGGVSPLTLGVPHGDHNIAHAREAVAQYVDELADSLNEHEVDVAAEALEDLPIVIELDPDIESQLSA